MVWPFKRRATPVKRSWFRDDDGTFFRNANLVHADMKRMRRRTPSDFRRLNEMHDEWDRIFWAGVERKDQLGPDDVEVEPVPMREAYPQYPILWTLDEPRSGVTR